MLIINERVEVHVGLFLVDLEEAIPTASLADIETNHSLVQLFGMPITLLDVSTIALVVCVLLVLETPCNNVIGVDHSRSVSSDILKAVGFITRTQFRCWVSTDDLGNRSKKLLVSFVVRVHFD